MRTLVLSARLGRLRVTVMERMLPVTISRAMTAMQQVRRAMTGGDRLVPEKVSVDELAIATMSTIQAVKKLTQSDTESMEWVVVDRVESIVCSAICTNCRSFEGI